MLVQDRVSYLPQTFKNLLKNENIKGIGLREQHEKRG